MNTKKKVVVAFVCAMAAGVVQADPRPADMLANTCAGCHGTNGASNGTDMPTIAGLDKAYLERVMTEFANERRPSTIMGRIARGYSDLEISAIAGFFAGKTWANTTAKTKSELVAAGKEIHEGQCSTCHGESGTANRSDVPRLAGQWPAYLYNQLRNFHEIENSAPQPLVMRKMIQRLNDDDLHALAHYYASRK